MYGCWSSRFFFPPQDKLNKWTKRSKHALFLARWSLRHIGRSSRSERHCSGFCNFRDPPWSILTLAQIGAASADAGPA